MVNNSAATIHLLACITTLFISFVLEFEALNDLSPQ